MTDQTTQFYQEASKEIEQELTIATAMDRVVKAIKEDPEYAWSWQCNIAMAVVDTQSPVEDAVAHLLGNLAAARFLGILSGVDMHDNPLYNDWLASFNKENPEVMKEFWQKKHDTVYKGLEGEVFSSEYIEKQRKLFFGEKQ